MKNLEVAVMSLEDLATREQVFAVVDRIGNELRGAEESVEKLRYMLGKSMAFVQDTWVDEFQSFEQWTLGLAERLQLSRATLRKALGDYRALPGLSLDKVARIPMTNLSLVAQVVRGSEISGRKVAGLLRRAEGPLAEFRSSLEEEGLIGNHGNTVSVVIKVKRRVTQHWRRLVDDSEPAAVFAQLVERALHQPARRAA